MPEREEYDTDYDMPLSPLELGCWLRMRISTRRGRVTGFVVQLEYQDGGMTYPIVRYDCAHGQPHKDTLNMTGQVVNKEWLSYSYDRALAEAKADIMRHWQAYRDAFLGGLV